MTDEAKQLIQLQLSVLKQTMKDDGVVFLFKIDKSDASNSELCFMDKKELVELEKVSGFGISLTELNRELL